MRGILKVGALGILKHRNLKSMENFLKNTWEVAQSWRLCTEADSEPCQTSKMELLENIVSCFRIFCISVNYFRKNVPLRFSTGPLNLPTFYAHIFLQWTFNNLFNGCFCFQISATSQLPWKEFKTLYSYF